MQTASLVQAIWRGLHARRRMRAGAAQLPPTRAEPGLEHVQLLVRVTAVRAGGRRRDDGGGLAVGYDASGGGGFAAEMFLGPGHEFAIEIDAGEMARSAERADVVSSGWQPLPLPRAPEEAPAPIGLALDLKHGGRARTAMREALHRREHHERPSVLISLLVAPEGHAARIGAQVAEGTQRARKANRAAKLRNALDDAPCPGRRRRRLLWRVWGAGRRRDGRLLLSRHHRTTPQPTPPVGPRWGRRGRRAGRSSMGRASSELEERMARWRRRGREGSRRGRERVRRGPRVGGGAPQVGGEPQWGAASAPPPWESGEGALGGGLADVPPPTPGFGGGGAFGGADDGMMVMSEFGVDEAGGDADGAGESLHAADSNVSRAGSCVLPLLSLAPHDDEQWVVERWVDLIGPDGLPLMQARVEVSDAQMLRRMVQANKLRETDELRESEDALLTSGGGAGTGANLAGQPRPQDPSSSFGGASSSSAAVPPRPMLGSRGGRRSAATVDARSPIRKGRAPPHGADRIGVRPLARVAAAGSGSGAASSAAGTTAESGAAASAMAAASLDMVDALRRHVADECVQLAAIQHSLVVSRFIANPDAAELSSLLPRLDAAGVTTLDVSYCLELRSPPLLLHALRTLPALTALDLTACDLLCEGAACVAAALGGSVRGAQPALASLSLRANRIGELGAAALGAGIARCTSLLRLDLSANPLGDDGLIRLICGEPKPKADEEYGNAEGGAQGEGGGRGVASGLALLRAAATLDGSEDGHSGGDGRAEGGEVRSRRSKQSAKRSADESGGGGDGLPSGLRHSSSLEALLLSKVGIGSRSVPAVGALVVELDTLRELDLSVNSFSGVDEWAAQSEPRLTGERRRRDGLRQADGGRRPHRRRCCCCGGCRVLRLRHLLRCRRRRIHRIGRAGGLVWLWPSGPPRRQDASRARCPLRRGPAGGAPRVARRPRALLCDTQQRQLRR